MNVVTLVSWNAHCDNGNLEQVNALISKYKPDILCIQETSPALKEHLEGLNEYPYFTQAVDHHIENYIGEHFGRPPRTSSYLVTVSRIPFIGKPILFEHKKVGVRIGLARLLGWHECIEHHGVDIEIAGKRWRILNIHIAFAETFRNKMRQFREVIGNLNPDGETIICGDFNITKTPTLVHLPSYLLRLIHRGHSIQEQMQGEELIYFEQRSFALGLNGGFPKKPTHPTSGLHLDGVLSSSKNIQIELGDELHGSDHLPLIVRFGPTKSLES
ncbi:MAG: endonuclease/exonuclease/phosphatase family protein [Candidatus Pacebacteria bacterium]|jgi:endonuclease/exonuclease/phosphatase family metal-dependent hydrolase|nr:hypothetical protein [bacterium]MDP6527634.1 endonuclease/exonuclease/phosphatase family protein [Candidatus Paceibacterota bacterium]MDP6659449.1 endonuclease/exonuclease/phosphatase family protein [Candidatus Paceibacterota bacterium]|tara:strand:+ start:4510 stop:5325 length:816 start_codon:yes stop_codon:yes gene_type:complete